MGVPSGLSEVHRDFEWYGFPGGFKVVVSYRQRSRVDRFQKNPGGEFKRYDKERVPINPDTKKKL